MENSEQAPAFPIAGAAEKAIKEQYETFPYPARDPADERQRLLKTILDSIPSVNHFAFGGQLDFSKTLRVLIAGGGTGDSLIYIAQQLQDFSIPAEIIYLDLSRAARQIAEARASVRGLRHIRFETGSLLDLDRLVPEQFDYINCSGVLHHLQDPIEGLRALERKLCPKGGLGLMLYAKLGRTGVYPVQAMLRIIAPETQPAGERIRIARKLMADLPENNWLKRNPALTAKEWTSDSDLFDLLLNSQDVAYDIEEVAQLVAAAGLRIASFMPPALFEPSTYMKDPELLERVSHLRGIERAAFAEKLIGTLNKLVFYAVRIDNPVSFPDPKDLEFVPILDNFPSISATSNVVVPLNGPYFFGTAQLTIEAAQILCRINGRRRLEDIRRELHMQKSDFNKTVATFYPWMHNFTYIQLSRTPWIK